MNERKSAGASGFPYSRPRLHIKELRSPVPAPRIGAVPAVVGIGAVITVPAVARIVVVAAVVPVVRVVVRAVPVPAGIGLARRAGNQPEADQRKSQRDPYRPHEAHVNLLVLPAPSFMPAADVPMEHGRAFADMPTSHQGVERTHPHNKSESPAPVRVLAGAKLALANTSRAVGAKLARRRWGGAEP